MNSNWEIGKKNVSTVWQCDDIQNNCDKCGKLYRYNWRRRRTREKACNLCVNEVNCNLVVNIKRKTNGKTEVMNTEQKPAEENFYFEKRTWNTQIPLFQFSGNSFDPNSVHLESAKKAFGFQDFTDQLLFQMKIEFGEELRNPQNSLRTDFEWPSTNQLNKVDCLRAFNIMKQVLLRELSKCEEVIVNDPLVLKRKFYIERRFQSLEREKIRRLKVYESFYI